jgi:hypothetical protein
MNMQEEELRQLLHSHGWKLTTRKREGTKRDATYLIAWKDTRQVYLTSRRQLPIIEEGEILEKIKAASG